MKLTKIIKNFRTNHLNNKMMCELHDHEILRSYLPTIFPPEELIGGVLNLTYLMKKDNSQNLFSLINLPFHVNNEIWLTGYINYVLGRDKHYIESKTKIKTANIQSFIKTDTEFNIERIRFEKDVVRNVMRNIIEDSKMISYLKNENIFRQELSYRMRDFDIPKYIISESILNNLDLIYQSDMEIK